MPGQPLSRIRPNAKFKAGADVFQKHPNLMALAMQTVAAGAGIDYVLSFALTQLLHADPKTGMAIYTALTGGEGKRAALLAAAKARLQPADNLLLEVTLQHVTSAREIRNEFAHHLWGYSEDVPNAALLIDPKCMIDFDVGAKLVNQEIGRTKTVALPPSYDKSRVMVFREGDLKRSLEMVAKASLKLTYVALGLQSSNGADLGRIARQQLLSEPAIQRVFEKRMSAERIQPL
jgi:hypothetical protein